MESKAKIFGHAGHPIMIVFPLGLLATAVVFDAVYLIWGNPSMATVAFWMMIAGIIGGFLAAPFGLIDWLAIPKGTRANSIGAIHGLVNVGVLLLFIGSSLLRYDAPGAPETIASILSFAGAALSMLGGWLGGELVERLGVAVDDGANLDAPNSLTHSHAVTRKASASRV